VFIVVVYVVVDLVRKRLVTPSYSTGVRLSDGALQSVSILQDSLPSNMIF